MDFFSWVRQPTTITGLASIAGAVSGAVVQSGGAQGTVSAAIGAAVFAGVHLVVNDNTVAQDASRLAATGAQAAAGGTPALAISAPELAAELFGLLRDAVALKGVPAAQDAAETQR